LLAQFLDVILHLDVHLNEWIRMLGPSIYGVLFGIVFCETGLVITPFLPGDSLLFALGALAAGENAPLSLPVLLGLLTVASILGDAVNYAIGYKVGPAIFKSETSIFLNKSHLERTNRFYEKYGGKTIIMARFIPIIRTFAPFVAGVGKMKYRKFAIFNVVGGVAWVVLFLGAGYYFGNLPSVKKNFHLVIFAIIGISLLPPVIEWLKSRGRTDATQRVV
jgi:membrane-associated protein